MTTIDDLTAGISIKSERCVAQLYHLVMTLTISHNVNDASLDNKGIGFSDHQEARNKFKKIKNLC